jgi:hypothetical protein
VDQSLLATSYVATKLRRRRSSEALLKAPRDEQEVASSRLQGARAWKQKVGDGIANGADAELVAAFPLDKRSRDVERLLTFTF